MSHPQVLLFDETSVRNNLLPFTFTRPVCDIRIGILTIREKWEHDLKCKTSTVTQPYLREKFPMEESEDNLFINGSLLPYDLLVEGIKSLAFGETLVQHGVVLAMRFGRDKNDFQQRLTNNTSSNIRAYEHPVFRVQNVWDIFSKNGMAIEADFKRLTAGRTSATAHESNTLINPEKIFIEPGATVMCSVLNASGGSIYIGKDAEVMEGSLVRGPFALGEHSALKLGTKVYGPTTIGPHSKVGGEVNNSVIFGYTNKGHDGFLGNSVLGEWCNLGADTNNSNLKNNYGNVKLWNYNQGGMTDTGLQFCGLFMGDHSKCGINTMFNTGTVVGVCANIFGAGFPPNFIPSFSWGGADGFTTYQLNKAYEVAERVMSRREVALTIEDRAILEHIFESTEQYRKTEHNA
jgi:UDP-N-acetylglucosamine diphosphorylase/glucosamine-1-phosphate N-acetyltransferase